MPLNINLVPETFLRLRNTAIMRWFPVKFPMIIKLYREAYVFAQHSFPHFNKSPIAAMWNKSHLRAPICYLSNVSSSPRHLQRARGNVNGGATRRLNVRWMSYLKTDGAARPLVSVQRIVRLLTYPSRRMPRKLIIINLANTTIACFRKEYSGKLLMLLLHA
jgi:hypothetical protein